MCLRPNAPLAGRRGGGVRRRHANRAIIAPLFLLPCVLSNHYRTLGVAALAQPARRSARRGTRRRCWESRQGHEACRVQAAERGARGAGDPSKRARYDVLRIGPQIRARRSPSASSIRERGRRLPAGSTSSPTASRTSRFWHRIPVRLLGHGVAAAGQRRGRRRAPHAARRQHRDVARVPEHRGRAAAVRAAKPPLRPARRAPVRRARAAALAHLARRRGGRARPRRHPALRLQNAASACRVAMAACRGDREGLPLKGGGKGDLVVQVRLRGVRASLGPARRPPGLRAAGAGLALLRVVRQRASRHEKLRQLVKAGDDRLAWLPAGDADRLVRVASRISCTVVSHSGGSAPRRLVARRAAR